LATILFNYFETSQQMIAIYIYLTEQQRFREKKQSNKKKQMSHKRQQDMAAEKSR
jgi:hypothetical protein